MQRPGKAEPAPEEEEGLYTLVRKDEALRALHVARLRATTGYQHLTEEEAAERVEQLIRLSALFYEMLQADALDSQTKPDPAFTLTYDFISMAA